MKRLITLSLLALPATLFAQGYQLNLQGSRQIGMGSTGVAHTDDASSMFFNPGLSSFSKGENVVVGVSPVFSKGTYTDNATQKEAHTENGVSTPFHAYALFGKESSKLKYGLAIYTPFGSAMKWEDGAPMHYDIKKISLLSVAFQPTISYKVTDRLGIGAGFVYAYGHVTIDKDLPVTSQSGTNGTAEISSSAHGFGANIGIYYRVTDQLSAGLTYRSALNMKTSGGKATFNVPASVSSNFPSQGFSTTLPLPETWNIGFAYKATDKLLLAFDAALANWKPYDTIVLKYDEQPVAGKSDYTLVRNYKTAYSFKFGAEYKLQDNLAARAGVSYSITPVAEGYVAPDVPDANRLNPSIGMSYSLNKKLRIDAAVLYEYIKRADHNVISNLDGTYKFNILVPSISAVYRF